MFRTHFLSYKPTAKTTVPFLFWKEASYTVGLLAIATTTIPRAGFAEISRSTDSSNRFPQVLPLQQSRHEVVLQNPEKRALFDYKYGTQIEARKEYIQGQQALLQYQTAALALRQNPPPMEYEGQYSR